MKRTQVYLILISSLFLLLSACSAAVSSDYYLETERSDQTKVPTITPSVQFFSESTPSLEWNQPIPTSLFSFSGQIAYISNRSGLAEIWFLDLTTGSERQLTETDCGDTLWSTEGYVPGVQRFTWAPNGGRIAYLTTCTKSTSQAQLRVFDVETDRVILIADQVDELSNPSWASSGDCLVFTRSPHVGECGMYIANLNEDMPTIEPVAGVLEDCLSGCYNAAWSPDGTHIAYQGPYVEVPGIGSRTYVSVVDLEGNHLAYEPGVDYRTPWIREPSPDGLVWSNNGCCLAIATTLGRTGAHLVLAEITDQTATIAEASGLWQRFQGSSAPFGPGFYNPVFTPDDKNLYFVSLWPDSDVELPFGTIYSVPTQDLFNDSPPDVQVVSLENQLAGFPSLSPDGEWLIYAVKIEGANEIWIQTVDGAYRQQLVGDGFVNTRPAWRPLSK